MTPAPLHATGANQPAATRWRHGLHGARDITPMVIGGLPLRLTIGAGAAPAVVIVSALLVNARIVLTRQTSPHRDRPHSRPLREHHPTITTARSSAVSISATSRIPPHNQKENNS